MLVIIQTGMPMNVDMEAVLFNRNDGIISLGRNTSFVIGYKVESRVGQMHHASLV